MDAFLTEKFPLVKHPHKQVGVEFTVPGTWWANMPPSEMKKEFKCIVTEWDEDYTWARSNKVLYYY